MTKLIKSSLEVQMGTEFKDIYIVGKLNITKSDKQGFDSISLELSAYPPPEWITLFNHTSSHTHSARQNTHVDGNYIIFEYNSSYEFQQQQLDELIHAVSQTNIDYQKIATEKERQAKTKEEEEEARLKTKEDAIRKLKFKN